MVMHLLPAYYTTTSTRKRRSSKKSKSLLEAERKHAKYLKRVMGIGNRCYGSTADSNEGSIPSSPAKDLPPLSNVIPVGVAAPRKPLKHNFTIAPAYNKGAYQVISERDIKDIGR